MSPAASFIVADILADRNARAATFGTDSVLAGRTWSAVKTGTSKDMRDNWCVGFSRRYTVGVWVGNASGAAMWDVSGTTGAAPVWQAILRYLDERERGANDAAHGVPVSPKELVHARVVFDRGIEAEREEWFLAGTETGRIVLAGFAPGRQADSRRSDLRIRTPIDGSILALDPDIPPSRQRMRFETSALTKGETRPPTWRLDGKRVGHGPEMFWPLWPGRHKLELVDAKGDVVDTVRFEVRGAQIKQRAVDKTALR